EDDLAVTRYILEHHEGHVARVYMRIDIGTFSPLSERYPYGVRLSGVYGLEQEIINRMPIQDRVGRATGALVNSDWINAIREWLSPTEPDPSRFIVKNGVDIEELTYSHRVHGDITRERLLGDHVEEALSQASVAQFGEERMHDFVE